MFIGFQGQQGQQEHQQHRQQSFAEQPQFIYQAGLADNSLNQDGGAYVQQSEPAQQQPGRLLRTHFSPSNEVSHVKFSSGDLSYNF